MRTTPPIYVAVVLAGTFWASMGTTFDESKVNDFGRDAFMSIPAEHPDSATGRRETVVQVHGLGPFGLTYVN
jgi:hypothetical protein